MFIFKKRLLCLLTVFCLFFVFHDTPLRAEGILTVKWIDVKYGDAILVITPNQTSCLIDAGSEEYAPKVLSVLENHRVKRLDQVIITHAHENHFGALLPILQSRDADRLYVNGHQPENSGWRTLMSHVFKNNIPTRILQKNHSIALSDNVRFAVVWPDKLSENPNMNSIAIFLTYKDITIFLSGDIPPDAQKKIADEYPLLKDCAVVQIPHHGAGMNADFFEAVSGSILVASTGDNPYFAPLTDKLYAKAQKIYRTDVHGTITLKTDGKKINLTTERIIEHAD